MRAVKAKRIRRQMAGQYSGRPHIVGGQRINPRRQLKKRIIRRCTQAPNSYVWSNNGVPMFIGDLMTVGSLNNLAQVVQEQARKDILVADAAVTVEPVLSGGDAIIVVTLSIRLRDRRDVSLVYKLPTK